MPDFHEEFKASIILDISQLEAKTLQAIQKLEGFKKTANQTGQVKLRVEIAQLETSIEAAKRRLAEFKKQGDTLGQIQARIDIRQLQDSKNVASKALRDLQKDADNTGKSFFSLNGIIRDSLKVFGGFFIIQKFGQALKDSLNAAISFESAFTGIVKTVDASEEEFAQLSNEFRELAKTIPVPVEGLAKIGELAGQLGIKKNDILDFTKSIAAIATATNLTEEEAATSFARIANIYQAPVSEVERLASAIVALGNNFATTETEILNFSNRIAGSGKIVGLTQANIAAISTAFTSVGIEAEAGGTAVQKSLLTINDAVVNGGIELENFASLSGVSAKEFAEIWRADPAKGFDLFVKGLANSGEQASNVLEELVSGDVRLQRAFLSVSEAGDLLTKSIDTANTAFEENVALTTEAERRYATTESQLQLQSARWNDLKIRVGDFLKNVALPAGEFFLGFAEAIGGATNQFTPFIKIIKAVGIALASSFSAKLLLSIAQGFTTLSGSLVAYKAVVAGTAAPTNALVKALVALRTVALGLLNPFVAFTAAAGLLAFAVLDLREKNEEYKNSLLDLNETLQTIGEASVNTASQTEIFSRALEKVVEASQKLVDVGLKTNGFAFGAGDSNAAFASLTVSVEELRAQTIEMLSAFGATDAKIKEITGSLDFFGAIVRPSADDIEKLNASTESLLPTFTKLSGQFNKLVEEFQKGGLSLEKAVDQAVSELSDQWEDAGVDIESFTKSAKGTLVSAAAETDGIGAAYGLGFRLGFTREEVETLAAVENLTGESLGILLSGAVQAGDRGAVFGLLWAAGVSEKEAEAASAAQDLAGAVTATLRSNEGAIRAAGVQSGVNAVQGVLDGIVARFPALQKAANAIAKALGAIETNGKALPALQSGFLFGVKKEGDDIAAAFKKANSEIAAAASSAGSFKPSGGGGGGGGASKALAEAEKQAKEAEKAVNDFEKALQDSNSQAKKLRNDVIDFYQDIVDSIAEATEKQEALNLELQNFSAEKTNDFVVEAGERDAELLKEEADLIQEKKELSKDLAEIQARLVENGEDQIRKTEDEIEAKEKIKELEAEILAITNERGEIQAYLTSISGEGNEAGKEALAAFEEAKRRATLSEFEQNKLALEDAIKTKEAEINAEIAKQKRIIEIQTQFLAIQEGKDQENLEKKRKLLELATREEIVSAEERERILKELGFGDLTQDEQLGVLKNASTIGALDQEVETVRLQQEQLLATKQEYTELAEQLQLESLDRVIARTQELIAVIQNAQQEQIRLNELASAASRASAASTVSTNVNIVNNNANNVDVQAAMNRAVNQIK